MNIVLNYRHKSERLEEALQALGHSVIYNVWDINEIMAIDAGAVIFEFKQIVKEEIRFLKLTYRLKRAGIPTATWCLDIPNIGARYWKIPLGLRAGLVDVFATHSMQGVKDLKGIRSSLLYLPNAAWTSRYNLGKVSMEDLRNPDIYNLDVSFVGNIDSKKHPEHRHRTDFLNSLAGLLRQNGCSYRFEDGRFLNTGEQIELIQRSKVNITFGCAADRPGNRSWGLPERCYGIPACGGFLLSDERAHAADDFIAGEEIAMFKGLDDCLQKILHYREASDERRGIAERAYRRVLKEHTYVRRAERLLASMKISK